MANVLLVPTISQAVLKVLCVLNSFKHIKTLFTDEEIEVQGAIK